jgi:phosphoglycolate phosphatase
MNRALLLFDLDGTLIDSAEIILAAQARAFAAVGLPMPERARALSIVGLSLREAFEVLTGVEGPIEPLIEAYKGAFNHLRMTDALPEDLFAGAAGLLDTCRLRESYRLGIATGKTRRGVDALIAKQGWGGWFATIQTADDAPSKPDPAMVLQAGLATGIEPSRIIMIGDSSYDMHMARAAGARAIGVGWGFQPRAALVQAGAEAIAEDFAGLAALIEAFTAPEAWREREPVATGGVPG